jgi:hypothetical protein
MLGNAEASTGAPTGCDATMAPGGFTFAVESTVEPELAYLSNASRHRELTPPQTLEAAWRSMLPEGGTIDAMSPPPSGTVEVCTRQNLFAKAVHASFYGHHPLVLSPDVIWLTIM